MFAQQCADALDAGAPAADVLERMKAHYTLRSLNVMVCKVRQMCRLSADYEEAVAQELADASPTLRPLLQQAIDAERRTKAGNEDVDRVLARLPPRLPQNVRDLRLQRTDVRTIKRMSAEACTHKNKTRTIVDGRALLAVARDRLARASTIDVHDLAFAILLVTGRRQCEVLSGRMKLDPVEDTEYAARFTGQAKRKGMAPSYRIPLLCPWSCVHEAYAELLAKLPHDVITHAEVNRLYGSKMSTHLNKKSEAVVAAVEHPHGLRSAYTCMALRLFDWPVRLSEAYVSASILGHRGLTESLSYTPLYLGKDFHEEPSLGPGRIDEDEKETLTT